jgi:hypothetical protein
MTRFYQPDLSENIDSPFVRDGNKSYANPEGYLGLQIVEW